MLTAVKMVIPAIVELRHLRRNNMKKVVTLMVKERGKTIYRNRNFKDMSTLELGASRQTQASSAQAHMLKIAM